MSFRHKTHSFLSQPYLSLSLSLSLSPPRIFQIKFVLLFFPPSFYLNSKGAPAPPPPPPLHPTPPQPPNDVFPRFLRNCLLVHVFCVVVQITNVISSFPRIDVSVINHWFFGSNQNFLRSDLLGSPILLPGFRQ